MGDKTGIAWTDASWNCLRGCSKVSEGCRNCYAEAMASRFCGVDKHNKKMPYHGLITDGRWNGEVKLVGDKLDQPLRWQRPRLIFVNSMSDVFHESVTFETAAAIFGVMAASSRHTFQLLTKRAERMFKFFEWLQSAGDLSACLENAERVFRGHDKMWKEPNSPGDISWPLSNVWIGVSAENQKAADERVPFLMRCPASVRWVSAEPLIGPIDFSDVPWVTGAQLPDWIVLGGESGPNARPLHLDWVRKAVRQCNSAGVKVFVKQLGSAPEGVSLIHRAGADPEEWPVDLVVRQWPRGSTDRVSHLCAHLNSSRSRGYHQEEELVLCADCDLVLQDYA